MNLITAKGGYGSREAVEIALWHAKKEAEATDGFPLNQVIIIGDAAPNTKEEVTEKRLRRGEDYWKTTKFAKPVYYENEVAELKRKKIKLSSFYVDD